MAPDLLQWLGVASAGRGFELVVWALTLSLGALLCYRERLAGRPLKQLGLGWLVGLALLGWGAWRWIHVALFDALYFGMRGLRVPTYGVLMFLGFIVGLLVLVHLARRSSRAPSPAQTLDLSFWVLIGSLIGARVMHWVAHAGHVAAACRAYLATGEGLAACLAPLRFWEGGLVFYGGFLGALAAGWLWCRRHEVSYREACDRFVVATAIGHAIGRLGCYAAGCCFGTGGQRGWLVQFPVGTPPFHAHLSRATEGSGRGELIESALSHPIHAVQLYEVAAELLLFGVLLFWLWPRRRYAGQALVTWLVGYGLFRFALELFRDDPSRGFLFVWRSDALNAWLGLVPETVTLLSTSQAIAGGLVVAGVVLALRWRSDPFAPRGEGVGSSDPRMRRVAGDATQQPAEDV